MKDLTEPRAFPALNLTHGPTATIARHARRPPNGLRLDPDRHRGRRDRVRLFAADLIPEENARRNASARGGTRFTQFFENL